MRYYYYDRPYNPQHVNNARWLAESRNRAPRTPYANAEFEEIYYQFERQFPLISGDSYSAAQREPVIDPVSETPVKDKFLEYVDWRQRREARLNWEAAQRSSFEDEPVQTTRRVVQDHIDRDNQD
jgi:hypothetical protein